MVFIPNTPRISRGVHFSALECTKVQCRGGTMRNASAECISVHYRDYFRPAVLPAGCTHKFIRPAGGAGLITACFAYNLVCIRPVAC